LASATVENYVKTVYRLSQVDSDQMATTGRIATSLGVSPGTVTSMLKTLDELGFATYTPYEGARLTEEGHRLALRVFRRHRLLECFLAKSLGLDWDKVHDDAERMEHAVSDELIERIDEYLGHPRHDPHGDPIPDADGSLPPRRTRLLSDCPPDTKFQLAQVTDQSPQFLRYLSQLNLDLGVTGWVLTQRAEAGIMVVRIDDREITLSRDAAKNLSVTTSAAPRESPVLASECPFPDAAVPEAPGAAH
jgi:DtxR family Mn-dependent transcriptional regulator